MGVEVGERGVTHADAEQAHVAHRLSLSALDGEERLVQCGLRNQNIGITPAHALFSVILENLVINMHSQCK